MTERKIKRSMKKVQSAGTIKAKVGDVVNVNAAIRAFMQKKEGAINGKTGFILFRWLKKLNPTMETYEEQRIKLVEEYKGKDDIIPPGKIKDFNEKLNEVWQIETDEAVLPFSDNDFSNTDLPLQVIEALSRFAQ